MEKTCGNTAQPFGSCRNVGKCRDRDVPVAHYARWLSSTSETT